MSTHKHIERVCCVAIALALLLTILFMNGAALGIWASDSSLGYEDRIFDTATVHTIDIRMDDWEGFLEECTDEEYVLCDLVIDGESYNNVAIRAKGNTSLTQVAAYGNDRYSFKVEFDHYDSSITYHGLDKLSLNNIIQDNTYMKDYLTYRMMGYFGVDAPLCSFVYLTVNGEDWGLYLAVEGVEDAFLERNYGGDHGELYKPDSMSMGGGRGNGGNFDMEDWMADRESDGTEESFDPETVFQEMKNMGFPGMEGGGSPELPQDGTFDRGWEEKPSEDTEDVTDGETAEDSSAKAPADGSTEPGGNGGRDFGGMPGGMMGSDDVSLIYTDDDYDSYSNIFDNAKTDITDADKDRLIASLKQLNEGENIADVVDVDEVIRYFVVHNFVCNFDSYTGSMIHNYYLYEEDGQLSMIPWDYNLAFGGFQGGGDATSMVNYPIDTPVSGGTVESRPMLAWIFGDEEYTALYHQYFDQFITEYFESGYFQQLMAQTKALIAPYVEQDPTKFCTYEEFETGFDTLEQFCLLRAQSIRGQLEGTIPATSDGQNADSDALVDASAISISDMGAMNNGGGMGGGMNRGTGAFAREETGETLGSPESAASVEEGRITAEEPYNVDADGAHAGDDPASAGSVQIPPDRSEPAGPQTGQSFQNQSGAEEEGGTLLEEEGAGNDASEDAQETVRPQAVFNGRGGGGWDITSGQDTAPGAAGGETLLLLCLSGAVLAVGLLIASLYKKRG
jgi:spore coat protein CotH